MRGDLRTCVLLSSDRRVHNRPKWLGTIRVHRRRRYVRTSSWRSDLACGQLSQLLIQFIIIVVKAICSPWNLGRIFGRLSERHVRTVVQFLVDNTAQRNLAIGHFWAVQCTLDQVLFKENVDQVEEDGTVGSVGVDTGVAALTSDVVPVVPAPLTDGEGCGVGRSVYSLISQEEISPRVSISMTYSSPLTTSSQRR